MKENAVKVYSFVRILQQVQRQKILIKWDFFCIIIWRRRLDLLALKFNIKISLELKLTLFFAFLHCFDCSR